MSKLLPCPFCGEAEKLFDNHVSQTNGNTHIIYCGKCHTTGPWAPRKKAGDAWNTRTDPVKIALAEALIKCKKFAGPKTWEKAEEALAAFRREREGK